MRKHTIALTGRRSFLERLGLGAGALVLSPIARKLVGEARGAEVGHKRVVFYLLGGGIDPRYNFTPPEFKTPDINYAVLGDQRGFTWPAMIKALEPWRNRTLLVDGLANQSREAGVGHSMQYSALTCVPGLQSPGGISIDQFIANAIGSATPRRSVLVGGAERETTKAQFTRVFAFDKDRPAPFLQQPHLLYEDLFGGAVNDAATRGKRTMLFDLLRTDIKRLQSALAGPERAKLDDYLGQLDDVDRRSAAVMCSAGAAPAASTTLSMEDRISTLVDLATTALVCGVTNVVGVSNCTGNPHSYWPKWKTIAAGTSFATTGIDATLVGHDETGVRRGPGMDLLHNWDAGNIARMIKALQAVREGDGTAFDNTVIVYMSDNGENHHASHNRFPTVIVGNAGGKLRADGRFLRYPKKGTTGARSMADLFCTLATAVGAPTSEFGKGGFENVTGALAEVLA